MKFLYSLFTISCLIFIGFSAFSQNNNINPNGFNVFYHENGQKSSEGYMVNGEPDGYWKTYHENGILKSEGNRKDFELDSIWRFYNEEGNLSLEINYMEGKKNGVRKTIRDKEIVEENFVDDVKQGFTIVYFQEGGIKSKTPFDNGLENGLAMEFSREGNIINLIEYKKGFVVNRERVNRKDGNGLKQGKWKYFYENGIVRLEGTYKDDKKNGYFKEYDKDGNMLSVSKFVDDIIQEDVAELVELEVRTDYYPNGRIKTIASYKDDVPEGVRREYDESGKIKKAYIFKEGIITGEGIMNDKGIKEGAWKEYFPDGKLRAEGLYDDGNRTGEWKFFHRNGSVEQIGHYNRDGRPDGLWQWFFASGEIRIEENYFDGYFDGYMVEYDDDGKILTEGEYIEGYEEGFWYYELGESREEGYYSGGYRNGLWKSFYSDGELSFEGEFIDDNPNGKHTYYWDNGKIKDQGRYIMGKKEGDWQKNNYDGSTFLIVTYKNGIETKYDGIKIKPEMEEYIDVSSDEEIEE